MPRFDSGVSRALPDGRNIRAIALDLDGTLLDTIADLADAVNLMLDELGLPRLDPEQVRARVGKGMANLVKQALIAAGGRAPQEEEARAALALYQECYAGILSRATVPYPGVLSALQAFQAARMPLAVITNKATRFTVSLLAQQRLEGFFDLVVCGDTLAQRKPHPLPLLHAAEHFGIAPGELLMVGDSINDVEAALAAGCPMIGVPYGYNEGRPIQETPCPLILPDLLAVAELLGFGKPGGDRLGAAPGIAEKVSA